MTIIHFCNMINIFHKDYLQQPIVMSLPIDFASPIAKLIAKLMAKRLINVAKKNKANHPKVLANKQKKARTFVFLEQSVYIA